MTSSEKDQMHGFLCVLIVFLTVILGVITHDFWQDWYGNLHTYEEYNDVKYAKVKIDSMVQVGDENRFLLTGDLLNHSYKYVGYSKSINNATTPIIIQDSIFYNSLIIKNKECIVGYSQSHAFVIKDFHKPLSLKQSFIDQSGNQQMAIIAIFLCIILFIYLCTTVSTFTPYRLLFILNSSVLFVSLAIALVFLFVMSFSWYNCFKESDKYNNCNKYVKYNIEIDSFNVKEHWEETKDIRSSGQRIYFKGYVGSCYAKELDNYKTKIDVDDIMFLTDTLRKPLKCTYVVWFSKDLKKAFVANYLEQNKVNSLSDKLRIHLFSGIVVMCLIPLFIFIVCCINFKYFFSEGINKNKKNK